MPEYSPKHAAGLFEILVRKAWQLSKQKTTRFPKPERKALKGKGNNKSHQQYG